VDLVQVIDDFVLAHDGLDIVFEEFDLRDIFRDVVDIEDLVSSA